MLFFGASRWQIFGKAALSHSSSPLPDLHSDIHPGVRQHVDQSIEREPADLSARKIRDAGLGNLQSFRSICLGQTFLFNELPKRRHQFGPYPEIPDFGRREAKVPEDLATPHGD